MAKENTGKRFALAERLMKMRYGDVRKISEGDAYECWPPTGDEDRSIEGAMRAMALASGGNRPVESLTTQQRIERDLDEGFTVEHDTYTRDWIIRRRLSACPRCQGRGHYIEPDMSVPKFVGDAEVSMDDTIVVNKKPCDHRPD